MVAHFVELLSSQSLLAAHAFVLLVLLLCGLGLPLPEDVVLVTGGALTWLADPIEPTTFPAMLGDIGLWAMIGTGLVGCLAGDALLFFAGRRFGARISEIPLLRRLLPADKQRRVEHLTRRYGRRVVFLARFMPGLRSPTFFMTGHAGLSFWKFLLFDGMAALLSVPLLVSVGYYFGDDLRIAAQTAARFSHYVLGAVLLAIGVMVARALHRRRAKALQPD
jgi:membrane protein DedA with SNARE-associated domain